MHLSFSGVSDSKEYNEEELKNIAEVMSPMVTSLLNSNEVALDNFMSTNQQAWLEEEAKFGAAACSSDEEDNIGSELDRLADAEQLLRDELETSNMGFSFMTYLDQGSDVCENRDASGELDHDHNDSIGEILDHSIDDHDEIYNESSTEDESSQTDGTDRGSGDNDNMLKILPLQRSVGEDIERNGLVIPRELAETNVNAEEPVDESPSKLKAYTLYDHAEYIGLLYDNADLGYPSCPLLTKADAEIILDVPKFRHDLNSFQDHNSQPSDDTGSGSDELLERFQDTEIKLDKAVNDKVRNEAIRDILKCTREYVKPMKSAALCRIYAGLDEGKQRRANMKRQFNDKIEGNVESNEVGLSIKSKDGRPAGNVDEEIVPVRTAFIQIRPDVLVGAVMDAVYTSISSLKGEVTKRQGGHLRALLPGQWVERSEYIPFRTFEQTKNMSNIFGSPIMQPSVGTMNGMVFMPPIVVDAQLCTRKMSRVAERILLVRSYSIIEGQILDDGAAVCHPSPPHVSVPLQRESSVELNDVKRPNNVLRESASLFQRMRTVATIGGKISFDLESLLEDDEHSNDDYMMTPSANVGLVRKILASPLRLFSPSSHKKKSSNNAKHSPCRKTQRAMNVRFDTSERSLIGKKSAQRLASDKLQAMFTDTPSALDEVYDLDPISALSHVDWPYTQSSWRFLADCLNELDNRDLGYSTFVSCAFGAFPSLPTLDVHYCAQMKELCKDNMVSSLLKSARDLEVYAKEAEFGCAKLTQILEPMLISYEEELSEIPEAVPLIAYPLDYTAPEISSPPWGQRVVEALNLIAVQSPEVGFVPHDGLEAQIHNMTIDSSSKYVCKEPKTEFQRAREAVSMVLTAFQKQFDEELSARLGRKNCQVMDRLAKMQAYKREAIMIVRGSYGINALATKAANNFHEYAKGHAKADQNSEEDQQLKMSILPASDQVPLLSCRVIVGGSAGMCYVTYHELLLVTQSVPLFGDNHFSLVLLNNIEVEVKTGRKSRLNPVPSMLIVKEKSNGEELLSFRPSAGAHLFKDFVDIVKEVAGESPEALSFSSKGGLLNMFDEKRSVAMAALGGN